MRRRSTLGLAFLLAVSTIVITAGPAFAAGDITGTVTSELGQPIPGICVEAHDSTAGRPMSGSLVIGFDRTADDGTYAIAAIADGDYKLFFYDEPAPLCGHHVEPATPEVTAEWHNNVADFADATVVSIADGDQVVDAVLTGTGTVLTGLGGVEGTLSGGTDLSCMTANLYDTTDFTTVLDTQQVDSANTYFFTGLITTLVYTLQFVSNGAYNCGMLASEWHGDIPVRLTNLSAFGDLADTFTVDAGATLIIDPTLTELGTVSGMMTSERTGGLIDGAPVRLYPLDDTNNVGDDWIQVNTIADGTFVINDPDQLLVAGNYKLEAPGFTDAGGLTWDGEWWKDADTGAATVLVVAVGADTALPMPIDRHGPGALTGTVTEDGSSVPIEGATVTLYEDGGIVSVGSTTTAADGTYTFVEVNSGTFDLEFTATGYDTEWFDNAASAAAGSLTVGSGQATIANAALLLSLLPGRLPGSISGTITDDSGPVSGVTVEAYVGGAVIGSATSAPDGTYTISELVGDTYTVLANTGPAANPDTHFSAWYTFAPLFLTDDATDVVVGLGDEVTGINIALQPLFVDVVVGSVFYAHIVWMQESGITFGCGNDAYCASDSVTRAEMASFLVRALELAPDATNYFTDDNGNIHERNINTLRANNVTLGCNPDLYCPNDSVRRDHMAAFIHRVLG